MVDFGVIQTEEFLAEILVEAMFSRFHFRVHSTIKGVDVIDEHIGSSASDVTDHPGELSHLSHPWRHNRPR